MAKTAVPFLDPDPTIPEACKALGCSRPLVYKLLARRDLDSYKVGANRRITIASLRRLMKREDEV